MRDSIVIKSNPHGITLFCNPDISFEQLVRDICAKFANSRDFFGSVEMVLAVQGRDITAEEAAVICEAIELNSDIRISLVQDKNELKEKEMLGSIDKFFYEKIDENAKIVRGNLPSHKVLKTDGSVIILGDVKADAKVEAGGNVIVLGRLSGSVTAGLTVKDAYIVAGTLDIDTVTLGDRTETVRMHDKWYKRMRKGSEGPVAIVNWKGSIICEPLASGILKNK